MSGYFECCHQCKPPKRYSGCHAKCKEYLKAKEAWDKVREAARKEREDNETYLPRRRK